MAPDPHQHSSKNSRTSSVPSSRDSKGLKKPKTKDFWALFDPFAAGNSGAIPQSNSTGAPAPSRETPTRASAVPSSKASSSPSRTPAVRSSKASSPPSRTSAVPSSKASAPPSRDASSRATSSRASRPSSRETPSRTSSTPSSRNSRGLKKPNGKDFWALFDPFASGIAGPTTQRRPSDEPHRRPTPDRPGHARPGKLNVERGSKKAVRKSASSNATLDIHADGSTDGTTTPLALEPSNEEISDVNSIARSPGSPPVSKQARNTPEEDIEFHSRARPPVPHPLRSHAPQPPQFFIYPAENSAARPTPSEDVANTPAPVHPSVTEPRTRRPVSPSDESLPHDTFFSSDQSSRSVSPVSVDRDHYFTYDDLTPRPISPMSLSSYSYARDSAMSVVSPLTASINGEESDFESSRNRPLSGFDFGFGIDPRFILPKAIDAKEKPLPAIPPPRSSNNLADRPTSRYPIEDDDGTPLADANLLGSGNTSRQGKHLTAIRESDSASISSTYSHPPSNSPLVNPPASHGNTTPTQDYFSQAIPAPSTPPQEQTLDWYRSPPSYTPQHATHWHDSPVSTVPKYTALSYTTPQLAGHKHIIAQSKNVNLNATPRRELEPVNASARPPPIPTRSTRRSDRMMF